MTQLKYIIYTLICLMLFSCSMTHRLIRTAPVADIKLPSKGGAAVPEVEDVQQAVDAARVVPTTVGRDSLYFLKIEKDSAGEISMDGGKIDAVYIIAKSKNVAERNGEIAIDFIITIPIQLQNSNWGLEIFPVIETVGTEEALQPLSICGELFSEVQKRQYWQMNKYLNRVLSDSTELSTTTSLVAKYYEAYNGYLTSNKKKAVQLENTYKETISFPYLSDSRLDSVLIRAGEIKYYYTQKYRPNKNIRQLNLFFRGKVNAIDRSYYTLRNSDTLSYNITSMISLIDNAPRYMIKVIDKYVQVRDRNYVNFFIGDYRVIDTLRDNNVQLVKIEKLMDTLINQYQFFVDSIIVTASSSPEGSLMLNDRLARGRAVAIKQYLVNKFGRSVDTLITARHVAEDWALLKRLIRYNLDIPHWEQITALINESTNLDLMETQIQRKYPKDYAFIKNIIYPQLRAVDFKYNLRRVDMVKDTIQLTVIDTTYMRGVQELRDREYAKALNTLYDYKCHNLAIAMLSLGYDQAALEILTALSEKELSAHSKYMTAIALSRLNRPQEGLEYYLTALKQDPMLKFRGALDPEIQLLFQQNNVQSSF